MQGNWSSFQGDLGYTDRFHIPEVTSVSFYSSEGFLGTLCSSVKQIKASCLFDLEQGIALHAMQGNQASSRRGGSFMVFLELHREPGLHSGVSPGLAF